MKINVKIILKTIMALINKDTNFDTQNVTVEPIYDLTIGQIIYMDQSQSREIEQQSDTAQNVKQIKKPAKTRSPVYKFFEWDEKIFKWRCTTCK